MSFFKRLSRSRGTSQSYVDDDYQPSSAEHNQARPPSSYQNAGHLEHDAAVVSQAPSFDADADKMYSQGSPQGYTAGGTRSFQPPSAMRAAQPPRADSQTRDSGYADAPPMSPGIKAAGVDHPMEGSASALNPHGPDLLTAAFHQAVKPYTEKIEMLEQQLADMQDWISSQEQQRMEIFSWIDKRGLRPDVPPGIAKQMDETSDAAASLNAQLDRKITIVNFDLHRLQDDLNDSISSAHFASAMAKFLPDIQRLAALRGGARFAYELLIKLVGNLNSHGGLESLGGDGAPAEDVDEDRRARSAFYARMDDELVDVVGRRAAERDDAWGKGGLPGEVKRLERNAAYLRNLGVDSYFPRALDLMKREAAGGAPAGYAQQQTQAHAPSQSSPPSYSH